MAALAPREVLGKGWLWADGNPKRDALAGIGLLGCCRVHSGAVLDVLSVGDGFAKARADIDNPLSPIGAQVPMGLSAGGRPGGNWCRLQPGQRKCRQGFWLCSHLFEHVGAWVDVRLSANC